MAVASPLIRRVGWPIAAALAFAFLVAVAMHGQRRDPMQEFRPGGLLTAFAPDDAREVDVAWRGELWRFRRDGGWQSADPGKPVPADLSKRLEIALRLLRNSAPLRVLSADEVAQVLPSEYALAADSLRVEVRAANGATFRVVFGGRNPLGAARYTKVEGREGVVLLPSHVGDAWEAVAGGPRE